MNKWKVEFDCDGDASWSIVTNGDSYFQTGSVDDADWLCAVLNREAESVALSAAYARMDPSECVAVSHGGAPSL